MLWKPAAKRLSIGLLSALFVLGSAIPAYGKTTEELRQEQEKYQTQIDEAQQKIAELEQEAAPLKEQINAYTEKINLVEEEVDTLEKQVNVKKQEISSLESQISSIEANIDKVEAEIAQIQVRVDEKQAECDVLYEEYCHRLRSVYISGSVTNLEVLLTSGDMSSLLTRAEMISSISRNDAEALQKLIDMMEEIAAEKVVLQEKIEALELDKAELEDSRQELLASKAELDESLSEVQNKKDALANDRSSLNSKLAQLNAQTDEYMGLITASQKQQDKIEAEIQQALGGSGGSYSGTGQFTHPCPGHKGISAYFPSYSDGSSHTGVDFRADLGTSILAADSGTVVLVKYLTTSYGYYVMINHGNGLSTLYAHCSSILVSTGQTVSKGQVIAKVGKTGNATGYHLHFEVRQNGTPVNPLNYL
ncbi:MAG: DUF3450 family protein [Clostridiales bacterium]|nr:DUF3450 family protein [Clostridiales bacterium]